MTTELPSGETSSAEKLTELKASSRVSLGLFWAGARNAQVNAIATTHKVLRVRIGFPVGRRVIQRRIHWRQVCDRGFRIVCSAGSSRGARPERGRRVGGASIARAGQAAEGRMRDRAAGASRWKQDGAGERWSSRRGEETPARARAGRRQTSVG